MATESKKPAVSPAAPQSSSRSMIMTMGAIGFFCGLMIVLTYQLTFPVIERNKAEALKRAVFEVVPGAETMAAFAAEDGQLVPVEGEGSGVRYFACYDDAQRFVGVAVETAGQGYADVINVLYGYSPEAAAVVGLKVLTSKETPGLGDKIEKDDRFRSNFERLEVQLDESGDNVVNPIALAKHGEKTDAWQVEAITGATISSQAIANMLQKSTAVSVPLINRNMETLEGGAQ